MLVVKDKQFEVSKKVWLEMLLEIYFVVWKKMGDKLDKRTVEDNLVAWEKLRETEGNMVEVMV